MHSSTEATSTPASVSAAASGTWTLGDLTVNRLGFGSMRLPQNGEAFADRTSGDRDRALGVLRRAVELGVNHIDTAAFYFSPLRSANELINSALSPTPTTWSSRPRSAPAVTPPGRSYGQPPSSCAARSRRTCASSDVITWTW